MSENNIVQDKMFEIISYVCYFSMEEMNLDLSVLDDLGINSLMIVEILLRIENELGINLESETNELVGCETLGDMINLVERCIESSKL